MNAVSSLSMYVFPMKMPSRTIAWMSSATHFSLLPNAAAISSIVMVSRPSIIFRIFFARLIRPIFWKPLNIFQPLNAVKAPKNAANAPSPIPIPAANKMPQKQADTVPRITLA